MLHDQLLLVLSLLFVIGVLHMLSGRLGVSYPILLVLGGLGLSVVPGAPQVRLDPDLVFLIFLPPLLYEAAWYTSWKDFWRLRGAISLQAFGLVLFTSTAVALLAHAIIPGFSLALGFLLGGIISPPDAVAATSVLHGLRVPRTAVTILEGESLINDASSLIVFRFALAAVLTGSFVATEVAAQFFVVTGGGVAIGLAVALAVLLLHRCTPTTPSIDASLTVMTPYLMYLTAERFHASGVLAVVAGGLYLSSRSHEFLSGQSRVQANGVWATLVFLLNGFVFILIGLQLPMITAGLGSTSLAQATAYAAAISALTIAVRIVWVFAAAYSPRLLRRLRREPQAASWKQVLLVAWAGMRGVVSLASALSVPLLLDDGSAFPQRDLVLFITFAVILCTLVLQGLSLPLLIRWLRFEAPEEHADDRRLREEQAMTRHLAAAALEHLDAKYAAECAVHESFKRLKAHYTGMLSASAPEVDVHGEHRARYLQMQVELVQAQKRALLQARRAGSFDHALLVAQEDQLDMEEARLRRLGH